MCETQDYSQYDIILLSSRTGEDRNSKQKIIIQCDSGCYHGASVIGKNVKTGGQTGQCWCEWHKRS